MNKPLSFKGKIVQSFEEKLMQSLRIVKKSNMLFFAIALIFFFMLTSLWDSQTTSYAYAYSGHPVIEKKLSLSILENENKLFDQDVEVAMPLLTVQEDAKKIEKDNNKKPVTQKAIFLGESKKTKLTSLLENTSSKKENKLGVVSFNIGNDRNSQENGSDQFAEKLYGIVGDTPIKEMVPFISKRDEKVAAFLIGIAKKESSFGLASPLKDGETCYNYWGYKGSGGRGVGMGYACFESAEEAIKVVGDRIEVLVNKQRNTPARMVDTWKCGTSCKGDPGAPGWVATVALYFEKIVS